MATHTTDSTDTRIIDTRSMGWEPFTGIAGGAMKVLARDRDGNPMVMVFAMPPGDGPLIALPSMPYRHYHQSVHEFNYFLAGELPHWDYRTPEDGIGELVVWTAGYYLDRRPGPTGIHGIETEPTSPVGSVVLSWRSGTGNFASEPDFHEESRETAYPASKSTVATTALVPATDGSGLVYRTDVVDILDTRAMAWQELDGVDGYAKVLSRDGSGRPATIIAWMRQGASASLTSAPERGGEAFGENLYVLSGELPHLDGAGDVVHLPEGTYVQRHIVPGDAERERAAGVTMPVGCTVLLWPTDGWE